MTIPQAQILISKCHFLLKRSRAPWRICFQDWGGEKHKMSLKHLVVPENKEINILKPIGRVSNWQNIDNLNIKLIIVIDLSKPFN